jgi:hypothetical protein
VARFRAEGPLNPGGDASHATSEAPVVLSIEIPPNKISLYWALTSLTKVVLSGIEVNVSIEAEGPRVWIIPGGLCNPMSGGRKERYCE